MSPRSKKDFSTIRESSKENILKTAMRLFSSNGYFNTSIREIAKSANISTGLLYNYFDSKEELLTSLLKQSFELVSSAIKTDPDLNPEKRIEITIKNFFHIVRTKRKFVKMLTQMGLQTTKFEFVNNMISKKYLNEVGKIELIFKEMGMEKFSIEAKIFLATLDGIMFEVLLMNKVIPIDELEVELLNRYKLIGKTI